MPANEHSDLKLHLHHASIEIERKFLIANDAWKHSVVGSVSIRDGLIASYKSRKVRVRISDQIAVITIKGPRRGIARAEYEYEIPLADAELIMSNICGMRRWKNRDILLSTRARYGMSMSMAAY
jgi:CYTH domain-containing protein